MRPHYFTKLLIAVLFIVSFLTYPVLILLIFSGFFLITMLKKQYSLFEIFSFSISISISLLIASFGITKWISIPFLHLYYGITIILFFLFLLRPLKIKILFRKEDTIAIASFAFIYFLFLRIFPIQLAPAGADMVTWTYTAEVIRLYEKFPSTYFPIVPIDRFGFMPYGMSVVISGISMTTDMPTYRSALLLVLLLYPTIVMALYNALRMYFSVIPSLFTIIFVLLVERDWINYIHWGGNPTIFSIFLILNGVTLLVKYFEEKQTIFLHITIISLLFSASFQTHQTPIIALSYGILPIMISLIIKKRQEELLSIVKILILTGIFSIAMLSSIESLSKETTEHVIKAVNAPYFGLSSDIFKNLPSAIEFIIYRFGDRYFILMISGLFIAIYFEKKYAILFSSFLIILLILVMNAPYMMLPLSPLLYPDRIVSTYLFFTAYFFAAFIEFVHTMTIKSIQKNKIKSGIYLVATAIIGIYIVNNIRYIYEEVIIRKPFEATLVTEHDKEIFTFIKENLPNDVIIGNNYGDGGLWIPVFTHRMVTHNDTSGHYLGNLRNNEKKLIPTHIYIGDKEVYSGGITFKKEDLENNESLKLIIKRGNAALYKIMNHH